MTQIVYPWPPKQLTPNAKRRTHWRVYQPIAKRYRADCAVLTKASRIRIAAGDVPVLMSITFYPPDRRHRDDDGMIGAFKAGRDGIADACGIDDRHFRPSYHIAEPTKGGKVVVEIEPSDTFRSFGEVASGVVDQLSEQFDKGEVA